MGSWTTPYFSFSIFFTRDEKGFLWFCHQPAAAAADLYLFGRWRFVIFGAKVNFEWIQPVFLIVLIHFIHEMFLNENKI